MSEESEKPKEEPKKKFSKFKSFKGLFKPLKTEDGRKISLIGDTEYERDDESGEFVNPKNNNDRIPYYVFGEKIMDKKLKDAV